MRVVLADIKGGEGFIGKDTVAGGYGSRLRPFSRVTHVISFLKRRFHDVPSVHLAYLAALAAEAGHEVRYTQGELVEGDVALVLSSIVDYRREAAVCGCDAGARRPRRLHRSCGGQDAGALPGSRRLHFRGRARSGIHSHARRRGALGHRAEPPDRRPRQPALPALGSRVGAAAPTDVPYSGRPPAAGSRCWPAVGARSSAPTARTGFWPATGRARSIELLDEIERLGALSAALCDFPGPALQPGPRPRVSPSRTAFERRGLEIGFECETRLDRLDPALLARLHEVGLRAISFGVESMSPATLKKVGRRPTPPEHQRLIIDACRDARYRHGGFYVLGFLEDNWDSIVATIDYAVDLGSTVAQFKILTPYPGTPLWKKMAPLVVEQDWERFDGFTPTFTHPSLTRDELQFLLGGAYARFYMRPSYLANYLRIGGERTRTLVNRLDRQVRPRHTREEFDLSKAAAC